MERLSTLLQIISIRLVFFGMPLVFLGSSAERFPEISSVGSDIKQGVNLGHQAFAERGHALPSLIIGPRSRLARIRFLRAVTDYCIVRDMDPELFTIEDADYTVVGGFHAMSRLLELNGEKEKHRAVFAANDLMALGAMMAVRKPALRTAFIAPSASQSLAAKTARCFSFSPFN